MIDATLKHVFIPLAMAFVLAGCAPPEPIRLGFIGGVSGRVADLGIGGRNGAALAIELRNKSGGVNGRMVELIVEDDRPQAVFAAVVMPRSSRPPVIGMYCVTPFAESGCPQVADCICVAQPASFVSAIPKSRS